MNFRDRYTARHHLYATSPKGETLTDQSQADECDLKIIVKRFMPGTMVPGGKSPQFGVDMTGIPRDLAEAIHAVRNMEKIRGKLPTEFQELAVEDLLSLTPEGIMEIIKKAAPEPPKPEEKKE